MSTLKMIELRCKKDGPCWIWTGCKDDRGRPQMHFKGRTMYVRRVVRMLTDGVDSIKKGLNVACKCGRADCVSPECSFVTTPKKRAQTAAARGVFSKPDAIRKSVLTIRAKSRITDEMVQAVRDFQGTGRKAAEMAGISHSHAKNIRAGTARKDYANPFSALFAAKQ